MNSMPVITITGLIGSGAIEVGTAVSSELRCDFIDRTILAQSASRLGTTEHDIEAKTERSLRLSDRLAHFLRTMLERSALSGGGADPYFGSGLDALLVREYRDFPSASQTTPDKVLFEALASVINDVAVTGNVVIAGRGANIVLADKPDVLHVGLHSSFERRVDRIMIRENLNRPSAIQFVTENDKARFGYFERFFGADPNHPKHYHITINTDYTDITTSSDFIVSASRSLTKSNPDGVN